VGARQFVNVGPVDLELGGRLDDVTIAYETWGTLDPDGGNAVLVLHALTGDAHVVGPLGPGQPTPGWGDGVVGAGAPLDPDRWFVVCPNVLGGCQGTTGPASLAPDGRAYGSRFPRITVRDQVTAEQLLADELGVERWALVVGGSMGGMRALEWLAGAPHRVSAGLVLAVGAAASADQIATQSTQNLAITTDPRWRDGDFYDAAPGDGPTAGLSVARRIAHLTYRSADELEVRFGNAPQPGEDPLTGGRYAVQSYLDHQADKLAHRFDAGTYVVLTEAMNTWDVGRDRGGVAAALASVTSPVIVAGIEGDRLYPLHQQAEIAAGIPTTVGGLRVIDSHAGHDGFLVEEEQVFALVAEAAELATEAVTLARLEPATASVDVSHERAAC
jgi:homoserine O-acetyltransferase